jgi:hypothetical protein
MDSHNLAVMQICNKWWNNKITSNGGRDYEHASATASGISIVVRLASFCYPFVRCNIFACNVEYVLHHFQTLWSLKRKNVSLNAVI